MRSVLNKALRLGYLQTRLATCTSEKPISTVLPSFLAARQSVYTCVPGISQLQYKLAGCRGFHTSAQRRDEFDPEPKTEVFPNIPKEWLKYNDIVYPIQKPGDPRRPAEVVHMKNHIKYSPKKLWYHAIMIRGMSVDEAIKNLSFQQHKGAHIIKKVVEECQAMAVKDHNVEFKSNLWVEDSFVKQSMIVKGYRKMGRGRGSLVRYRYSHYFLRLREGKPPKHYYPPPETGYDKMENYIKKRRQRRVILAL